MQNPGIPRWLIILTWLFGVLLPAGTLFYERIAHFCAQHLFDPLPSFLHVLVVAWVPLGFLIVLNGALPSDRLHRHVPTVLGSGLAISLIYTLPFVPLLGIAVVAILFLWAGFPTLGPTLGLDRRHHLGLATPQESSVRTLRASSIDGGAVGPPPLSRRRRPAADDPLGGGNGRTRRGGQHIETRPGRRRLDAATSHVVSSSRRRSGAAPSAMPQFWPQIHALRLRHRQPGSPRAVLPRHRPSCRLGLGQQQPA